MVNNVLMGLITLIVAIPHLLLSQITKLKYELESIIRKDKDSIIIFMRIGYLKICGVKKKINPVILFNIKNAYI